MAGSTSGARPSLPPGFNQTPPRGRAATIASNLSRESSKENLAPPDAEEYETQRRRIEELKAEVGTMRYTINNYEQERELARLQTDNEIREAKRRADEDFKAKQAADAERARAARQVEAMQAELESLRAEKEAQKRELEAKTRDAQEEARVLREQVEDLAAAKDEAARFAGRETRDLRAKLATTQRTAQELASEAQTREEILERTQTVLAEKDETMGRLEADILRLKAQTGDVDTIAIIRRELSDQVTHIRALEATNRDQLGELKHLRQVHKAVEIVEEEKRSLQRKLDAAEPLHPQLAEERRQRQRLEDERNAWAAYLERESAAGNPIEFDSPESVARALVQERLHSASLVERLGALQPELADRDNIIKALEGDKIALEKQVDKLKTSGSPAPGADKARARLERQRALATKEVEYLRAQLKTFDAEDITFQPESFDQAKAERIKGLEELVDQYRGEMEALQAELVAIESSAGIIVPPAAAGSKRPREDAEDDDADARQSTQFGQLARKNRTLQDELSALQTAHLLLQKEHEVAASQLASAREQLKTRVLSLRSNPTSDFEAVKTATLAALRLENAELVAHIQRQPTLFATVPASQLAAAQRQIEEARGETASAQKSSRRLKEVWSAKSAEFKEAVFSTLGWHVAFIPGGKMRVESVYHPSRTDEHENSIVFDGEKGTMKVGGGPRSAFATRIADNIKFWVRDKGCVPCFLAALTLEFYEEHSRNGQAA